MEQISLEEKVNNTLKWLANQTARILVYHWDGEQKNKSLAKVYNQWYNLNTQFELFQRLNDLSGCVSHKSHCV